LEILQNARTFHEQVQFFIGKVHHRGEGGVLGRLPPAVRELLDDIAGPEPLGEKILADVLHDDNVRKVISRRFLCKGFGIDTSCRRSSPSV
jgi:hypothetical protein